METASANDKVRFLIKLFLLHLLGHLVSLTTHFVLLLYRRAEIFNSGQNCDSLWNPVNLYNFIPYFWYFCAVSTYVFLWQNWKHRHFAVYLFEHHSSAHIFPPSCWSAGSRQFRTPEFKVVHVFLITGRVLISIAYL